MRKIAISLLFVLLLWNNIPSLAQSEGVVERLYIATDKGTYVAGDRIWCSLFCFAASDQTNLSDFSSTAYIELQNENQVVITAKIALVEGRGAGAIEIPPTMPTGNYRLVGYTAQNRNEEGFAPCGKILTIYNVLTSDRVEGNVQLLDEKGPVPTPEENFREGKTSYDRFEIKLPSGSVPKGKEFEIVLDNKLQEALSLSVSIYKKTPFGEGEDMGIVSFMEKFDRTTFGQVNNEFVPDYEGEVVNLKVEGADDERLYISFPGVQVNCYTSHIDSDGGAYVVTPNIYGDKDMVCEGGESVSIVDPYIRHIVGDIPKLELYPHFEEELLKLGFSMQVGRRFDADTLYERLPVRPNILLDNTKVVYLLDDYTRFPKMEEVLVEFVHEIRIRSVRREKQLSILIDNNENTYYSNEHSLVLLDGVPVTDQTKILEYDPLLVHRIEIYTGTYSMGDTYYEGIANFITYKGDMSGFEFGDNVTILPYKGALYPLAFTGSKIVEGGSYPDYRQTIYWHPVVDLTGGASQNIRCIAPLYEGDFDVVVEGVTRSGEPLFFKSSLKVR